MTYHRRTRDAVSKLTTPGHIYFIQAGHWSGHGSAGKLGGYCPPAAPSSECEGLDPHLMAAGK